MKQGFVQLARFIVKHQWYYLLLVIVIEAGFLLGAYITGADFFMWATVGGYLMSLVIALLVDPVIKVWGKKPEEK